MTLRALLPVNPDGGQEPSGGSPGPPGSPGQGVPTGGGAGTGLLKVSGTNYDTAWVDVATQAELDTSAGGLTLLIGEVANEVADLVAALGDPDQIAWGALFDATGEATGFPADGMLGAIVNLLTVSVPGLETAVSDLQAADSDLQAADGVLTAAVAAAALAASDAATAVLDETARALAAEAELAADIAGLYHISFDINAATMTPISNMGFDIIELNAVAYNGAVRTSEGSGGESVIFPIAGEMFSEPGLWTFTLSHFTGPDCGIYTIEMTDDFGATWDIKGTVDGYAAVGAAKQDVVTDIPVSPDNDSIRLRMPTKNDLSSGFVGHVSALSGYFQFTEGS